MLLVIGVSLAFCPHLEKWQVWFQHYFFSLLDPQPWSDRMHDCLLSAPHLTQNRMQTQCICSHEVPVYKTLFRIQLKPGLSEKPFPTHLQSWRSHSIHIVCCSAPMVSLISSVSRACLSPPHLGGGLLKGRVFLLHSSVQCPRNSH